MKRGRIERAIDWERLEGIGLDGRDVQAPKPPGRVIEDVPVRVEDRHPAAVRKVRAFDEVAGAGTHIKVPVADVLSLPVDEMARRTAPDEP